MARGINKGLTVTLQQSIKQSFKHLFFLFQLVQALIIDFIQHFFVTHRASAVHKLLHYAQTTKTEHSINVTLYAVYRVSNTVIESISW